MKSVFLLFTVIIFINVTCRAQWQQLHGPTGGYTGEMLEAGGYLFVTGIQGGIFRSSDDGLTWQPVNNGLPADYTTWAFSSYNTKLYVANSQGAYYSDDFGNSWASLTGSLDKSFRGFYSIDAFENEIYGGSYGGFYYSADHGATWTFRPAKSSNEQIISIKLLDGRAWIGSTRGLYYSDDQGITWTLKLNIAVSQLILSGGQLWVGGNDPDFKLLVMVSYDKGMTFVEPNVKIIFGSITGIFIYGNDIFVTTGTTSYFYSPDGGASWSEKIFPSYYSAINYAGGSVVYKKGSALFISYPDGILYSGDMGITWSQRNVGLLNQTINEIGLMGNTVVCSTDHSGIFVSTKNGDTWSRGNDPAVIFPGPFHIQNNTIVVGTNRSVYKSDDAGRSWQPILQLPPGEQGANHTLNFSGHGDRLMYSSLKGAYFSKDLGASWDYGSIASLNTQEGTNHHYVQGDTIILDTIHKFYTSTDFGKTWDEKEAPLDYFYSTSCLLNSSSIILGTLQGFYVSYDFGKSWELRPCAPTQIHDMKRIGQDIFVATNTGIYATPNEGIDWYPLNKGLTSSVRSIAIASDYTFAGTYGRSVWRLSTAELLAYRNGQEAVAQRPVIEGDCDKLTLTNQTQGEITWYKNNELMPAENSVILKTSETGSYHAAITTPCGAVSSNTIVLDSQFPLKPQHSPENVEVYNIITPNGDGKNELYTLPDALAGSRFSIYNRWGNMIYESPAYQNDWSAEDVVGGVYFYVINSRCFGTYKGTLTVGK